MNILLACQAGISTGIIADKMTAYAKNNNIDAEVWAVDFAEVENEVNDKKVDCVLIGPQIAYKLKTIEDMLKNYGIKVTTLSFQEYGSMDSEKIFKKVSKLMEGD